MNLRLIISRGKLRRNDTVVYLVSIYIVLSRYFGDKKNKNDN